ncbi:prephenate dehydrogenase [Maricaulis salignorans]|uniref:Prephenate dehydrogenase n=1 Tax=Maricaulis salignorans TaxID=144026 RepID=A0A1G9PXF0_9PROT|nr:prephenate dehydrogenase [Maricaulis salignorans]SDM03424.1 prephenate dehydrogenase [Maricaulis salignorans]
MAEDRKQIGMIGLGAFGRFAAGHLAPHFDLLGHDPQAAELPGLVRVRLEAAAACPVVVLAVPVQALEQTCQDIAPFLPEGALVLDVASVKVEPMRAMRAWLPAHVRIIGTHPLFGPQSAAKGLAGQSIVLCPDTGVDAAPVAALCEGLGLEVHLSDPDTHDRAMANVQALTHLVSRVIAELDIPPPPYTTKSYDLLRQATDLVRNDSDDLFQAIEQLNPYAASLRKRFFEAARAFDGRLEARTGE